MKKSCGLLTSLVKNKININQKLKKNLPQIAIFHKCFEHHTFGFNISHHPETKTTTKKNRPLLHLLIKSCPIARGVEGRTWV